MIDYLKSKALKEYHKKLNFVLPDEAVATLIYCSRVTLEEKYASLQELADKTQDENLKRCIAARLASDREDYDNLVRQEAGIVFAVEDAKEVSFGKFPSFEEAYEAGRKLGKKFRILKEYILSAGSGEDDEDEYDNVIGGVSYNAEAQMTWFTYDADKEINSLEYCVNSFEGKPFWMPHPFRTGDKVKFCYEGGEEQTGIVGNQDTDQWNEMILEGIKEGTIDVEETLNVLVEYPELFSGAHSHVLVMDLEYAD